MKSFADIARSFQPRTNGKRSREQMDIGETLRSFPLSWQSATLAALLESGKINEDFVREQLNRPDSLTHLFHGFHPKDVEALAATFGGDSLPCAGVDPPEFEPFAKAILSCTAHKITGFQAKKFLETLQRVRNELGVENELRGCAPTARTCELRKSPFGAKSPFDVSGDSEFNRSFFDLDARVVSELAQLGDVFFLLVRQNGRTGVVQVGTTAGEDGQFAHADGGYTLLATGNVCDWVRSLHGTKIEWRESRFTLDDFRASRQANKRLSTGLKRLLQWRGFTADQLSEFRNFFSTKSS